MTDDITHELAETLKELRTKFDSRQHLGPSMVRVDAILDRYAEPFMSPEKPPMTINLKDYEGKFVVVTLRNEWRIVSNVIFNEGYSYSPYFPYSIDGKYYSNNGKVFSFEKSPYDIVDIKLVDEDPEPVITRVEVITDKREYVNWEKDNKITTSIQDDGRTLKVFVNKTTEEPEMPITKPTSYDGIYTTAERETSKQWATALSGLIDELGGDSPALWEWNGITPTPEKVVECLRENIQYLQQLASDDELEACLGLIAKRYSGCNYEGIDTAKEISTWMRNTRRPQPITLKSQALKDFETVRKHSDLLPEILDNIENALKSLP